MRKFPYKLSLDYSKLQELLDNEFNVVCIFDGKVCIGSRKDEKYVFSIEGLCYCDFPSGCANMTFAETIKKHEVKFILPSKIANIFNIHFKVKIHNKEERKMIVTLLREAGFYEFKNRFRHSNKAYGITVGRASFTVIYFEDVFSDSLNSELSLEEVLKIRFK